MSSSGNVWYCTVPKQYLTVIFLDQNVELVQFIYFLFIFCFDFLIVEYIFTFS